MIVVVEGYEEIVCVLCVVGVEVNLVDQYGSIVLMEVVCVGVVGIVQLLVQVEFDVIFCDQYGCDVFILVCQLLCVYVDMVCVLFGFGVDFKVSGSDGCSVFDYVVVVGCWDLVVLFDLDMLLLVSFSVDVLVVGEDIFGYLFDVLYFGYWVVVFIFNQCVCEWMLVELVWFYVEFVIFGLGVVWCWLFEYGLFVEVYLQGEDGGCGLCLFDVLFDCLFVIIEVIDDLLQVGVMLVGVGLLVWVFNYFDGDVQSVGLLLVLFECGVDLFGLDECLCMLLYLVVVYG